MPAFQTMELSDAVNLSSHHAKLASPLSFHCPPGQPGVQPWRRPKSPFPRCFSHCFVQHRCMSLSRLPAWHLVCWAVVCSVCTLSVGPCLAGLPRAWGFPGVGGACFVPSNSLWTGLEQGHVMALSGTLLLPLGPTPRTGAGAGLASSWISVFRGSRDPVRLRFREGGLGRGASSIRPVCWPRKGVSLIC